MKKPTPKEQAEDIVMAVADEVNVSYEQARTVIRMWLELSKSMTPEEKAEHIEMLKSMLKLGHVGLQ